jgi:hypothetical protein
VAAGWSTVVVCIGCAAAGWFARDWQYERATRIEAERQLVVALEKPAATVNAERRLVAATDKRERGKVAARAGVSAAPSLADVPLPDDLSLMLMAQAEANGRNPEDDHSPKHFCTNIVAQRTEGEQQCHH